MQDNSLLDQVLRRMLQLLPNPKEIDWREVPAAIFQAQRWQHGLVAHENVDAIALDDLLHLDDQRDQLVMNTEQFLAGLPANNALLWGSRGTGKSSLIHALLNAYQEQGLRMVEIGKDDLPHLGPLVSALAVLPYRFIVFCDDLSFEVGDPSYKALKSALEGSIFKTAQNVLIYATSNRRHLVPEHMTDNEQTKVSAGELHEGEAVEEKISLSDRFGLWLSFYPFRQDAYLQVVNHWVAKLGAQHEVNIALDDPELRGAALRWALARGVRSGRTAQHFARHWVGQHAMQRSSQQ